METAREGLAYIMRKNGATFWEEKSGDGYIIFVPQKRGEFKKFFVPMANVIAAEDDLKFGGLPPRWVATDIESLPKKRKPSKKGIQKRPILRRK